MDGNLIKLTILRNEQRYGVLQYLLKHIGVVGSNENLKHGAIK